MASTSHSTPIDQLSSKNDSEQIVSDILNEIAEEKQSEASPSKAAGARKPTPFDRLGNFKLPLVVLVLVFAVAIPQSQSIFSKFPVFGSETLYPYLGAFYKAFFVALFFALASRFL